ncbi:MAG: Panacea domain-containing protein [Planctomycetaceae bacterium]
MWLEDEMMDASEKSARLIEAACAVLNAAPGHRLNTVVLNKTLFYLDLAALRDRAETLTGNAYIALQQGPVVAKYDQRLIGELETRRLAKQVSEWDGSKPVLLESCVEHFQFIDADALILVSAVTSYFAGLSSRQASDFSHENPGWQHAWDSFRRTRKPTPINMLIALQQIVEDDPWMDLPLPDDDAILAAADNGVGVDW